MKKKVAIPLVMFIFLSITSSSFAGDYSYYLPYFTTDAEYWSGLGLRNSNSTQGANVSVTVYESDGNVVMRESKSLPARGQNAFVVGDGLSAQGWMSVDSDQPLTGLCFFGTKGFNSYMADITLIPELSTILHVPHIAQNDQWDTTVMICNPNASNTAVTLTFADQDGNALSPKTYTIAPNGSGKYNVADLVSDAASGSVEISASQGVAGFALYHNLKQGGMSYAGISAVQPVIIDDTNSAVYPMIVDNDNNGINDYVEEATHFSGTASGRSSRNYGDAEFRHGNQPGDSHSQKGIQQGRGLHNHTFTDLNEDGICDYAQNGSNSWHGPGFVDEDSDGVCDYWDDDAPKYNMHEGVGFHDQNGNMLNDAYEAQWHLGNGHGFTDADGDGICDYAQDGGNVWHGSGFVDEDYDGVCDHWQIGGRGNNHNRPHH